MSTVASGGFINSSDISKLKFYETSYHWFIQRFYSLNTLSSNRVVYLPSLQTTQLEYYKSNSRLLDNASSQYARALTSPSALPMSVLETSARGSEAAVVPTALLSTGDVYLSYADYVLFSKSRVDSMQSLSKNTNSSDSFFFTPRQLK